ncbi:NlpC/P60 family protein [Aestuariivita boseongensis]|uniref:C40 family peptidase n=1 Tax=Aestuariivita boseongensis TaxID=1470562 RepID=UPI000A998366|nr:NlpC/P60 family protein [Aestuariivita boseongensis]
MSDPRLTPANARVMADHLPEDDSGRARVTPVAMQVAWPLVDLLRTSDGPRERQLLLGDAVDVLERHDGMAFVQARKDGYVGYVPEEALEPDAPASHLVSAPATHLYEKADLKSPDLATLSFGTRVAVTDQQDDFAATAFGFIPVQHLQPVDQPFDDPVSVAQLFLGTPYLWGGNSRAGIDCSGLVQAACLACGIPCPGDSDLQQSTLGQPVPDGEPPQRGDLLFWKGHVAWVAGPDLILHANAHTMSTNFEGLQTAIARIQAAGDGPMTAHKRLR